MPFQLVEKAASAAAIGTIANASGMIKVPSGDIWDIKTVSVRFDTSAAVGNRVLGVDFQVPAGPSQIARQLYLPVTTPASSTVEANTYDSVAAAQTYALGSETKYLLPWSPIAIAGSDTYGYISARDYAAIDQTVDQVLLVITCDVWRVVGAEAQEMRITSPIEVVVQ